MTDALAFLSTEFAVTEVARSLNRLPMLVKAALHEAVAHQSATPPSLDAVEVEVARIVSSLLNMSDRIDAASETARTADWKADLRLQRQLGEVEAVALAQAMAFPRGCYVYVLRDTEDRVLYVGKSTNVFGRLGQHARAEYGSLVDKVELIQCRDGAAMDRTECRLISQMQPPYNRLGIREDTPSEKRGVC